jgi:hypothetical protein
MRADDASSTAPAAAVAPPPPPPPPPTALAPDTDDNDNDLTFVDLTSATSRPARPADDHDDRELTYDVEWGDCTDCTTGVFAEVLCWAFDDSGETSEAEGDASHASRVS